MIIVRYEARNRNGSRNQQFYEILNSVDDPKIEMIGRSNDNEFSLYYVHDATVIVNIRDGITIVGKKKKHVRKARLTLEEETELSLVSLSKISSE